MPDSQSTKSSSLPNRSRKTSAKSFNKLIITETAGTATIVETTKELGVAREIAEAQIIINQIPLKNNNQTADLTTDHRAEEEVRVNKNTDPETVAKDPSHLLLNSKNLTRRTLVSKL